jgi:hypothetical protein
MNSLDELFAYALQNVAPNDMVGTSIRNGENHTDKAIGLSFHRRDQISGDVVWSVFEKVTQSNVPFNILDKLVIDIHSVAMPVGFGRLKTMGRPMDELINRKTSIIEVKTDENCLEHAIIIAIARINNDPDYKTFRRGVKNNLPRVQQLLATTKIDLTRGARIPELVTFQNHFANKYRIVVYDGFDCNRIMFDGQTNSERRINLLYDATRHYHVIGSLTGLMAKEHVCPACNKNYNYATMHTCDQTCPCCMECPPCIETGNRIPCVECNRHFRSQTCFNNHKTKRKRAKKNFMREEKVLCYVWRAYCRQKAARMHRALLFSMFAVQKSGAPLLHESTERRATLCIQSAFRVL